MTKFSLPYAVADTMIKKTLRLVPPTKLSERIALTWGYRYRPRPGIVTLRSGALVQTTRIDHLQLLLYYTGTFEPHCLSAMCRHLRSGQTMLDVGANIGLFSIEAARRVGSSGSVISIEALPAHADTLRKTLSLNNLTNVSLFTVAAGEAEGSARLTLPKDSNYGSYTLGEVSGDETVLVPVRTIDDILAGRRVDFIKMDIEGSELKALKGAEKTIARDRPPILIELNDVALRACGASSREIKERLFNYGYKGVILPRMTPISLEQAHHCDECFFNAGFT